MIKFEHYPVMLNECISSLNIKENGIYVDCTLGGGSHSEAILKNLVGGKLIAFDKDVDAINFCKDKLKKYGNKVIFIHSDFKNAIEELAELNIDKIDGFLMDLGISSYQIDTPERGFSYMHDASLDMRMDRNQYLSAYVVINEYDETELANIIYEYGEEHFSRVIAKNICKARAIKKIETTSELVKIIENAVPSSYRFKFGHPAKKTFQAIRIEVNGELENLKNIIEKLTLKLNVGGRAAIISFHSLEDRIVKQTFVYLEKDCICPPHQFICNCNKRQEINIMTKKPITATEEELKNNSRSKSAKLRVAERI